MGLYDSVEIAHRCPLCGGTHSDLQTKDLGSNMDNLKEGDMITQGDRLNWFSAHNLCPETRKERTCHWCKGTGKEMDNGELYCVKVVLKDGRIDHVEPFEEEE